MPNIATTAHGFKNAKITSNRPPATTRATMAMIAMAIGRTISKEN